MLFHGWNTDLKFLNKRESENHIPQTQGPWAERGPSYNFLRPT